MFIEILIISVIVVTNIYQDNILARLWEWGLDHMILTMSSK